MANKQIDELSELTTASGTDLLLVYDLDEAGSEKTKKIELYNAIGYESDTWTPVPADATSGGNTGTAATAVGRYTKIGNAVTAWGQLTDIDTTGLTAGNFFYIQGLPYANNADVRATGSLRANLFTFPTGTDFVCNILEDGQSVYFFGTSSGGSVSIMLVSGITSGQSDVWFTITYSV
jgi:hypothetical protein